MLEKLMIKRKVQHMLPNKEKTPRFCYRTAKQGVFVSQFDTQYCLHEFTLFYIDGQ